MTILIGIDPTISTMPAKLDWLQTSKNRVNKIATVEFNRLFIFFYFLNFLQNQISIWLALLIYTDCNDKFRAE